MSHPQNATAQLKKYIPKQYKKRRYYIKSELQQHNTANDIWLSFFNDIYDLTPLIQSNRHLPQVQPMIQRAGSDITHWFDDKTKEPRKCINAKGEEEFYLPQGRYLHVGSTDIMQIPWWKNQEYFIGKLTKKSQMIRIINTLSNTTSTLEVPREQSIWQILNRYEEINTHARSYTWKRKGVPLKMELNLADNGIIDQTDLYAELEVPIEQQYIPAIHIHFNDDLTSK